MITIDPVHSKNVPEEGLIMQNEILNAVENAPALAEAGAQVSSMASIARDVSGGVSNGLRFIADAAENNPVATTVAAGVVVGGIAYYGYKKIFGSSKGKDQE